MTKPTEDYQSMMTELQTILHDMQADDLDVDTAMRQYARGEELLTKLEAYLKTAENTIVEHRSNVSTTKAK